MLTCGKSLRAETIASIQGSVGDADNKRFAEPSARRM